GQMASGVAHDLNQKLALIVGHSELAQRALIEGDDGIADSLRIMGQAAIDGGQTVKRLLLFAQPDSQGSAQPIDVGELLHEVGRLTVPRWRDAPQAEGRPVALSVDTEPALVINGWADNLKEALTNLIFNAVDAMPAGGSISLNASRQGSAVAITVTDTGGGMSTELQSRAFEPFFSTKGENGTGLGLATVFSVAERHGGSVSLTSGLGQGTVVTMMVPSSAEAAPSPSIEVPPFAFAPLHILAVDDQEPILMMVSAMLRPLGHTVDTATSGEAALEHLHSHAHDLVISDVGMGDGMNGWDLAEQVQLDFPGLPVLLATGWGAAIDPEEARAKGVAGVIAKPFRKQDLVDAVNRAGTSRDVPRATPG
ncbi:MAG TPA: ATP-binding protein, partial [Chloroflexota bacterium]